MKTVFNKALEFTLKWEGGFVDHPNDTGGPTNKGITQKTYDSFRKEHKEPYGYSVKFIEDDEVKDIYWFNYWVKAKCGEIDIPAVAIAVFDFAVHSGVRRATYSLATCQYKHLQNFNVSKYIDAREAYLIKIGRGSKQVFLKGWINRLNDLRKYVKEVV